MSFLHVYHEADGDQPLLSSHDAYRISLELSSIEVYFDRLELTELPVGVDRRQLMVLNNDAAEEIQQLSGRRYCDLRGMSPQYPDLELRRELLCTESASDEEAWHLFLRGQAIFYFHLDHRVYVVGCDRGDLISVPAGLPHWLDIGPEPDFLVMTMCNVPSHDVIATASDIALRFPRFETLVDAVTA
ncbi:cupin [Salinicola acroporae]|uniref:Cupin n=1 Tax=Salinicola acroporae TaxID=1541440 RepID=A0ABT6IC63_9GAMM|nr:cupin [Salinicola acroporae]MDH4574430.1 cupin [Salinicola acroporae]